MAKKAAAYTAEPWQRLEGKVVLVTGASSGIGLQFCIDLAKAGCKLVAAARRTDRLECLCHKLNAVSSTDSTVTAVSVKLDLTADGKAIEAAVQKAWDAFGRIDALVNNAGVRAKKAASYTAEPWRSLEGKVVMVTGASSGLGFEFCLDLAKAGCKLIAAARRTDRLETLCNQINGVSTVRAVSVKLDVTSDVKTIEAAVQTAWDAFGHIDGLINNAGVRGAVKSAIDMSEEEWNSIIRTNLTGTWLVSKFVAARIRDAKRSGSIVNISSVGCLDGGLLPGAVAYAASKLAVHAATKVMALELGPYNIRVNVIAPGLFKSEITEALFEKKGFDNYKKRLIPLGDFGTTNPTLTSLVRYLIHDSSDYITGNAYVVDGGATLVAVPIFSSL